MEEISRGTYRVAVRGRRLPTARLFCVAEFDDYDKAIAKAKTLVEEAIMGPGQILSDYLREGPEVLVTPRKQGERPFSSLRFARELARSREEHATE